MSRSNLASAWLDHVTSPLSPTEVCTLVARKQQLIERDLGLHESIYHRNFIESSFIYDLHVRIRKTKLDTEYLNYV